MEAGSPLTIGKIELVLPKAGELLIKVEACGVCYSDTFAQAHGVAGKL